MEKHEENVHMDGEDIKEPTGISGSGENPGAEAAPPPTPKGEAKPKTGPLNFLFNRETRFGRTMRTLTRGAGIILGLFALGMFAAYFLLVRPVENTLDQTVAELQSTTQSLQQANQKTSELLSDQAKLAADLKQATLRLNFLRLKDNVVEAQLGLARTENPAVKVAMEKIAASLAAALPDLKGVDANKAALLETRLNDALTAMQKDPLMVQTNLERAYSTLLELEMLVFK